MHPCSIVASLLIITQQPFNTVRAACLSKEQFVASLDQKRTLVFEAVLLQNTAGLPHSDGFQAYVQITKVIQQPGIGWHLTPGSVAKIKGIRPRSVDYTLCLPQPVNGETYLWVTWSNTRGIQNTEGALMFYPGGLFYLETTKQNKLIAGQGPSPDANRTRTPNATISGYDLLQHDAPRQSSMYGLHATNSLGVINSGVCDVTPCPIEHRPVCGTDGVLYLNKCLLEQEACKKKRGPIGDGSAFVSVRIDYSGKCMQQNNGDKPDQRFTLCEFGNLCAFGAVCSTRSDETVKSVKLPTVSCICKGFKCESETPDPICANDGKTYANQCYRLLASCLKQTPLKVLYNGTCKGKSVLP
ncbi:unnamed protein product [Dicrocoelium dendriticum]|nr:unnamed protein product [Dicrocoelium dendriticum]